MPEPAGQPRNAVGGDAHSEVAYREDRPTSIRMKITVLPAMPTEAASCGR
jgi:hypothetical protein